MQLILNIPDDLAAPLRAALGDDLGRVALEGLVFDGYQTGTLGRYQVQRLLGFDNRWDAEEWLGVRGAHLQYSLADLDVDHVNLARLLDR